MATNLKSIHLFAGAGGGILADLLLGHRPICAVEIERYPRDILLMRQADGILPRFPVWDDVRTFRSDNPECARQFDAYRSIRDELVICGGFPCQDISIAGKGAGIDGERSGLWSEYARIVCEIRPHYVFVENSPMLTARGIGRVLGDLAALGYDAAWGVLSAADCGANHERERLWIMADRLCKRLEGERPKQQTTGIIGGSEKVPNTNSKERSRLPCGAEKAVSFVGVCDKDEDVSYANSSRCPQMEQCDSSGAKAEGPFCEALQYASIGQRLANCDWWATEPAVGRVAHGVANRVDRIKALGNGQVPIVAASAFTQLHHALTKAKTN